MKITKDLYITIENQNDFQELTECGYIYISENAKFTAPQLTTTGYIYIRQNAKFTAPQLTTTGYIDIRQNAKFTAPQLTTTGNIDIRQNAKFTAPFLKNKKYISIDNTLFVVKSEKSSKGLKIFTGYIIKSVNKNKIEKEDCFVSSKNGFFAHGLTVKKSIQDLQFKVISEKLKNEPIEKHTMIDINYYRLVTGSCEMGCKSFIEQNKLTKESYRADELLPILESKNAYGIEKFKSLINF